jgi:hypothetical protein
VQRCSPFSLSAAEATPGLSSTELLLRLLPHLAGGRARRGGRGTVAARLQKYLANERSHLRIVGGVRAAVPPSKMPSASSCMPMEAAPVDMPRARRSKGIKRTDASDVWAVGITLQSTIIPIQTLIEHWDGTQWSVVPSP